MKCNEHRSYQIGFELAHFIWKFVSRWGILEKDTIGKQILRSADSISSNISEGWNRYYKKDKICFYLYARASFYETMEWIEKAHVRNLISTVEYNKIISLVSVFPREINGLIKGTRMNLKK